MHLRDKWRDGPLTAYGLMTAGFPNMLTVAGPQSASVGTNFPRGIEEAVDWVTAVLKHMRDNSYERIEALQATEDEWVAEVKHYAARVFMGQEKSWMTGYNSNLERDQSTRFFVYLGGALRYRERLTGESESGYAGFAMG